MPSDKLVVCVGDTSDHGGTVISSGCDNSVIVKGAIIAADGAIHDCPIHGQTPITAITTKTFVNSIRVPAGSSSLDGSFSFGDIVFGGSTREDSSSVTGGKLVLTYGVTAGCGALITPLDRGVYAE